MNRRLLEFELASFDYSKINNIAYVKRNRNALLLWYYYNKTSDIISTVLFAKKLSPLKWFRLLTKLRFFDIIEEKYNLPEITPQVLSILISKNKCKECSALITEKNQFCSVMCSNVYKSKDPLYITSLSTSIIKYHNNLTPEEKTNRNTKIKLSVRKFNSELSKPDRTAKYTNNNIRYTSFDALTERFPDVEFLFSSEFYYNNKYLPVKCKKCSFSWEITKTTTLSRTLCTKCHPYKKHKTQTKIFDYINALVPAKENDKSVISNELDIYIPQKKIAFEYNGLLPHSFGDSKVFYYNNHVIDKQYHLRKTEECLKENVQLYHIFEDEFIDIIKQKIWYSVINTALGLNERIFARRCKVKEITTTTAEEFCTANHLQGYCPCGVKLGLFFGEQLVQVMTFRTHKKYQNEIARFCSLQGFSIPGGAGKLLKYFERQYAPKALISFANRRWSQGNVYEKLGFTFLRNTPPNYFYFRENENILYKREHFQKHKLPGLLENFFPELTEIQNMLNNKYRIIFDCGNKLYLKTY
ncbi:MAG: hypothetical protein HQ522_11800 [Bacteroidetes bacterium]|nr:hypothetical protein [Bacteroidota bacterium]